MKGLVLSICFTLISCILIGCTDTDGYGVLNYDGTSNTYSMQPALWNIQPEYQQPYIPPIIVPVKR